MSLLDNNYVDTESALIKHRIKEHRKFERMSAVVTSYLKQSQSIFWSKVHPLNRVEMRINTPDKQYRESVAGFGKVSDFENSLNRFLTNHGEYNELDVHVDPHLIISSKRI